MLIYLNMLKEKDDNVKLYSIRKLNECVLDDECVDEIYNIMVDSKGFIKIKLIDLLNRLEYKKVCDYAIRNVFNEKDVKLRSVLVKSLGIGINGENSNMISKFLTDEDPRVRANAVEALLNNGIKNVNDFIEPMRTDINHRVRVNVYYALYEKSGEFYYKDLIRLSKSENKYERAAIAYILSKIESKKNFSILISLLRDEEAIVRKNAVKSLKADKNITYLKYFIDLFTKERDLSVKKELLEAMQVIDKEKSVRMLIDKIDENSSEKLISEINKAFGVLKSDKAMMFLNNNLKRSESVIRASAIEALGKYKDRSTVNVLLPFLNDNDENVKIVAAEVLWKFGITNAYTSLKKMMGNGNDKLRRKAKYILAMMGL